jgi:hypothetical protein
MFHPYVALCQSLVFVLPIHSLSAHLLNFRDKLIVSNDEAVVIHPPRQQERQESGKRKSSSKSEARSNAPEHIAALLEQRLHRAPHCSRELPQHRKWPRLASAAIRVTAGHKRLLADTRHFQFKLLRLRRTGSGGQQSMPLSAISQTRRRIPKFLGDSPKMAHYRSRAAAGLAASMKRRRRSFQRPA